MDFGESLEHEQDWCSYERTPDCCHPLSATQGYKEEEESSLEGPRQNLTVLASFLISEFQTGRNKFPLFINLSAYGTFAAVN